MGPIDDALADLDGPVKAHREAPPQSLYHFTQADQVNQLVSASEADPDLGFMARLLALCSLPRTNPGNRHQYKRQNGPYTLYMFAGRDRDALRRPYVSSTTHSQVSFPMNHTLRKQPVPLLNKSRIEEILMSGVCTTRPSV